MTAQNIQFRGIRRSPSDITGQDGDLLDCVNLVHEDGELKPIAMPERSNITVPVRNNTPYILAHIHNTTDGAMFVFVWKQENGDDMLVVQDANNNLMLSKVDKNSLGQSVKWVQSVGNTLVIGTDKSIHYALYKNGEYKWLGDSLPRPVIDFQLEYGDLIMRKDPTPSTRFRTETSLSSGMFLCVNKNDWQGPVLEATMSSQNWYYHNDGDNNISSKSVRDNLLSKITSIISQAKQNNQFIFPFFVRYAIRLYDGSYVCHSNPILLLPSSDKSPIMATVNAYQRDWGSGSAVLHNNESGNTWECVCNTYAYGMSSKLKYYVKKFILIDNTFVDNMDDWSDVVKGVDIFCSSQISTIDFEQFSTDIFTGPIVGDKIQFPQSSWGNPPSSWLGYMYNNSKNSIRDKIMLEYSAPGNRISFLQTPSLQNDDYLDKVSKTNIFYLAKSYKLNQYNNLIDGNAVYYDEEVETNTLGSLESAKTLPDDYLSRSRIAAETGHTYNQRLVLGNIKAELPLWYPITEQANGGTTKNFILTFFIEKNGKTIAISSSTTPQSLSYYRFGHYIYYPDPDCKKVVVYTTGSNYMLYSVPMQEHNGLNGAYAIMPGLESLGEAIENFAQETDFTQFSNDRYYTMHNSIALAEVANPFVMQAENFREVGNGSVIDLAPNMMEVSSGQWGQYPLYVFSTDGIYAFGINNDGTLGAMSPVSSDVLLTPQGMGKPSLIQANQMLVFTTSRGVMGLQGTQARSLSLVMDGRHFNAKDDLGLDVLYDSGAFKSIVNEAYDTKPFHDFVLNSFLAYDYAHNRVLVLNDDSKYQYVLSLDSGLWSRQVTYRNLDIIQTNNQSAQQSSSRGSRSSSGRTLKTIDVTKISAAANNYTEMYLQGNDNRLYVTQNVTEENNNPLYQYGYFVSRPVRFGTDEFKTITRLLHRYTHYAPNSDVKLAMYGSRDGVNYGRINTLRGMSWKYYIFVVYTYLKPNERYSYMTVDFEPRLTNKLR